MPHREVGKLYIRPQTSTPQSILSSHHQHQSLHSILQQHLRSLLLLFLLLFFILLLQQPSSSSSKLLTTIKMQFSQIAAVLAFTAGAMAGPAFNAELYKRTCWELTGSALKDCQTACTDVCVSTYLKIHYIASIWTQSTPHKNP